MSADADRDCYCAEAPFAHRHQICQTEGVIDAPRPTKLRDLHNRITTLEAVLAAAVVRVEAGHDLICASRPPPGPPPWQGERARPPCNCGHDALAAACGKVGT